MDTAWNGDSEIHRAWQHVAIQLADGWWFAEVHQINSAGGTAEGGMTRTLGTLRVVDVGGVRAVAIPSKMTNTDHDEKAHTVETSRDELALCAVGTSGKPSCTAGLGVGETYEVFDRGDSKSRTAWAVTASYGKSGLELKRSKGKPPAGTVGKHPLKFP